MKKADKKPTAAELFETYASTSERLEQLELQMEAVRSVRDKAAIELIGMVPEEGIAATTFGYAFYSLDVEYSGEGAIHYIPPMTKFRLLDFVDKNYEPATTEEED